MPTKKSEELMAMTTESLQKELVDTQEFLQKMKFDHAIEGLGNPNNLRSARKDVARINTELRKREIAEMGKEELSQRTRIRKRRRKQ